MKTAICKLRSVSPYSQSKLILEKKGRDEKYEDFEERIWRRRLHVDSDGFVFMPPMCFKNALSEAAKYKSIKIPGKGNSTYTKHFEAGIMCCEQAELGIKAADVAGEWLHVSSDGKRGGSKRVLKCFPIIPKWETMVRILILDEIINEEVFRIHLEDAGKVIGVGRFRPRNNGYYGRFEVMSVEWK